MIRAAAAAVALAGCAHGGGPLLVGPEVEVAHDEGRARERPLTPPRLFEVLVRVDPRLPAFRPLRMRFQLAHPGHLVFAIYAVDGVGHPGALLKTVDRVYGPELTSTGEDGKWVVEPLDGIPTQHGALFIGVSCPEKTADPRLWATSNDSGEAFQREGDAALTLDQMKIPRTPRLRVAVAPE